MGFSATLQSRFSTTHENRFWNNLVKKLELHFSNRDETLHIFGNFIVDGKQIDALVIKEDAIIVIDFKDYEGTLSISENGPWTISGNAINPGRKNPYTQLSDHKYGILNALKKRLDKGYENWVNLGHINAIVLFHKDINYNNDNLQSDLSHSVSKWFSVSDYSNICKTLDEITSSEILINDENFKALIKALGLEEIPTYKPEDIGDVEQQEPPNKEQSFSEQYYSKARSLEYLNLLIIGQDPYPEGANGVAFCKTSIYGLYQAGCSGGIVLNSLGYSRQRAFDSYKNPEVMFYDLLVSKRVCFTNINNKEFKKQSLDEIIASTKSTRDFNLELLRKAKKIVLIGKGMTQSYFDELYQGYKPNFILIHPSEKNIRNQEEEWLNTWDTNTLQRILNDDL